jgi:Protein of unknown function (DUF2384)
MTKYCYYCLEDLSGAPIKCLPDATEICPSCAIDSVGFFESREEMMEKHISSFHHGVSYRGDGEIAEEKEIPCSICPTTERWDSFYFIVAQLRKFFKDDIRKVMVWLNTRNLHFGGSTPLKLIQEGRGHKVSRFVEIAAEENGWGESGD